MRRKEERSKQGQTNNKANQHSTVHVFKEVHNLVVAYALQLSGGRENNVYIHVVVKQEQETTETLRGRRRHGRLLTVDHTPVEVSE